MTKYGLTLASELNSPSRIVDIAVAAEQAGFDFLSISDHYHPWIGDQGHSGFVWTMLGAISAATRNIEVGVGVTCPTFRIHPAINAHAVATTATLLEGRFVWGVGSGEALNEHILGDRWPPAGVRLEMLEEAIEVVRSLLTGESTTHRGKYYTVEDARIFDLPRSTPPIVVAAFGEEAAELAARVGDGLWTTGFGEEVISTYKSAGGDGQIWSQLTLSWGQDRSEAIDRAHRLWPNTALPGQLAQDLPTVLHFEQAVQSVDREDIESSIPCGPEAGRILDSIERAREAGVDHIYLNQIGNPLDGFIEFWADELKPSL